MITLSYNLLYDSFWNIDFVELLKLYPVQATNRMESTFLALCSYELYVSEKLYERYYKKIIGNRPPVNFANFACYEKWTIKDFNFPFLDFNYTKFFGITNQFYLK